MPAVLEGSVGSGDVGELRVCRGGDVGVCAAGWQIVFGGESAEK